MSFSKENINELYRYSLSLTHNHHAAQDLVSESIEKILSRAFVINKIAYAKRCIRNKFYDNYRLQSKFMDIEVEEAASEDELEKLTLDKKYLEYLLKDLSPQERELLYLWAVEEHSLQQIANFTKTPKGTLTSRIFRIREKIKKTKDVHNER